MKIIKKNHKNQLIKFNFPKKFYLKNISKCIEIIQKIIKISELDLILQKNLI